jgi:hypothetical protein
MTNAQGCAVAQDHVVVAQNTSRLLETLTSAYERAVVVDPQVVQFGSAVTCVI